MVSSADKKKIKEVIIVPINYFYLLIGISIPIDLSIISYYLKLISLAIIFIIVIILIVIFLFLQKKRDRDIENIILHSVKNDKPVFVEDLNEFFVCISVTGVFNSAKILKSKLNKLERLKLIKLQRVNDEPSQ